MPELPIHLKWEILLGLIERPIISSWRDLLTLWNRKINGRIYRLIDLTPPRNIGVWKPINTLFLLAYVIYPLFGEDGVKCALLHKFLDMFCYYMRTGGSISSAWDKIKESLDKTIFIGEEVLRRYNGILQIPISLFKPVKAHSKIVWSLLTKKSRLNRQTFAKIRSMINRFKDIIQRHLKEISKDCRMKRKRLSDTEIQELFNRARSMEGF